MLDLAQLMAKTRAEARPYQGRIVSKVFSAFTENKLRSILIESPVGSGKTIMALLIAKALHELAGLRIGWVAMRRYLLHQVEKENQDKGFNVPLTYISMFDKAPPTDLDMLIVDEAQHDVTASMSHIHARIEPKHILGMSVGGDSMVLVKSDGGIIHYTTIANFIDNIITTPDDRITYVKGWSVRAFNGTDFVWKKLKSVIRHQPGDKKTYRIYTQKGRSLLVTEDHCVYRVVQNGTTRMRDDGKRVSGKSKPVAALEEVRGRDLRVGDWLLLEDSLPHQDGIKEISVVGTLKSARWNVAGAFAEWIEKNITEENGYKDAYKVRHVRQNGRYGPYLTSAEFLSLDADMQRGRIYFPGRSNSCQSHIPVAVMAYLIGFYLGNGWTDNGRVIFSANPKQLPRLKQALERLSEYAEFGVEEQERPGCTKVRINNKILCDWFRSTISKRAWNKSVPDICFSMSLDHIKEVIAGMLDTDGHQNLSARNRKTWNYVTTSKSLAYGLCELLKFVNVTAGVSKRTYLSGGKVDGHQIIGKHEAYHVHFSGHAYDGNNEGIFGRRHHFVMGDLAGHPVKIKGVVEEKADYVYDFSVDDDHWQTFVANGFLVHNSATPVRSDRVKLCFDKVIKDAGISTLIMDGFLSPYHHFTIPKWGVEEVTALYAAERDRWGKSIMYFHRLEQCAEAQNRLLREGITCDVVSGASDTDEQIANFFSGKTQVLINCMKLTEGLDIPDLKTVFCRPSCKSLTIQMAGRVLRKCPDCTYKQIVQAKETPYVFTKTAPAALQHILADDGSWRTLQVNPNIDKINKRCIRALAHTKTEMPDFIKKATPHRTRRWGGRRSRA